MEMRIPPEHVPESLVSNYHSGKKTSAGSFLVELTDQIVNQPRDISEQSSVMSEKRSERLGNSENEIVDGVGQEAPPLSDVQQKAAFACDCRRDRGRSLCRKTDGSNRVRNPDWYNECELSLEDSRHRLRIARRVVESAPGEISRRFRRTSRRRSYRNPQNGIQIYCEVHFGREGYSFSPPALGWQLLRTYRLLRAKRRDSLR
jgi:hypothetical protein